MTFIEERESLRRPHGETVPLGEVSVTFEGSSRDSLGRRFEKRNVIVGDESDRDPMTRQAHFERANQFEAMLQHHPEWRATHLGREEDGEELGRLYIDLHNLAAVDLYLEDGRETQMFEWGHQMMQAIALEPLQNLGKGGQFLSKGHLDQRTLERFMYMPDGRGLRSRQHIYSDLLVQQAVNTPGDTLRIVSLGSGASVPNIEASQKIEQETGKHIEWQLFDLDPNALFNAERMTNKAGLALSTFDFGPKSTNPNQPGFTGRSYIEARHAIEDNSLDAVDALGLWEYLEDNQAKMFLKMMYKKLKPDAPMIISNMRKKRPHPLYNKRAVGWPDVIMRSDEDLLDIVYSAEIPTEQVRLTTPEDSVYVVMEIRKP
jgi:hypothetical protein